MMKQFMSKVKTLHVGAAQVLYGGSPERTLRRMEEQIIAASVLGVDVLLFSECVIHGYDGDMTEDFVRSHAEPIDGSSCSILSRLAVKYGLAILAGFMERAGDSFHTSQLVAFPDGSRDVQRKHCITAKESMAGISGGPAERKIFEFKGVRAAILVCADTGMKDLNGMLKQIGAELRFVPTAGGGDVSKMLHECDLTTLEGRKRYEEARAQVFITDAVIEKDEYPRCFVSANAMGPVGRRTCHWGHCIIADRHGVLRAQLPGTNVFEHQQDSLIHAELSF